MSEKLWDAYGYKLLFRWDAADLEEIFDSVILPDWTLLESGKPDTVFELTSDGNSLSLMHNDEVKSVNVDRETIRQALKREAHIDLATYCADLVFVHAGVVHTDNGLILIPGRSFSGKSTLTKSLIEAGARFYSDEYAVINSQGLVRPFPRPHCERLKGGGTKHTAAEQLGWSTKDDFVPVSTVLITRYQADGNWQPTILTAGEAVLRMLENTVSAQTDPKQAILFLSRVAESARCVESPRGESEETARSVLHWMRDSH